MIQHKVVTTVEKQKRGGDITAHLNAESFSWGRCTVTHRLPLSSACWDFGPRQYVFGDNLASNNQWNSKRGSLLDFHSSTGVMAIHFQCSPWIWIWIGYVDSSHFWYCRQRENSGRAPQKKKKKKKKSNCWRRESRGAF